MPITGTPIDVLTTTNPVLDKRQQTEGKVTTNKDYAPLDDESIELWPDFNYHNVISAFGSLLTSGAAEPVETQRRHGSPFEIHQEDSLDRVMNVWNLCVCRDTLKAGAAEVQARLGLPRVDITMRVHEQDLPHPSFSKALVPDFCIYAKDSSQTVLVWGENKLSSKWKSDRDALGPRWAENWLWPFRQLATYCIASNTRYGCILTPDELVVVRVFKADLGYNVKHSLQYASIPWENNGTNNLTVNLGLWVMAMLALNTSHRCIINQPDVLPLNVWWKDKDRDGKRVYEHHLTGVRSSRLPARAIAKERPAMDEHAEQAAESSSRPKRSRRQR